MKWLTIVPLLVLSCILYSSCAPCTKRVDCPEYAGDYLYAWFPYWEVEKTFYFSDGTNRDTLIIDDVFESKPYKYNEGTVKGFGGDGEFTCDAYGIIQARENKQHLGWLNLRVTHHASFQKGNHVPELEITLNNYNVVMKLEHEVPAWIVDDSIHNYNINYSNGVQLINGNTYKEVFIITTENTDTAIKEKIDKVYIAKGYGLIGYRTYPDFKEYWLQ